MAFADIIILALVAGFILLRLRSVLGQKTGLPPQMPRDYPQTKQVDEKLGDHPDIIELQADPIIEEPEKEEELVENHAALSDTLKAIRKKDPSFRAGPFLEGAKMAFETVLAKFAERDRKTLASLFSKDLYNNFDKEMARQEKDGKLHVTTLIGIKESLITDAKLNGSVALLTVRFLSEQMESIKSLDGKVLETDKRIEHVEDHWTFERKLTSSDPNWTIVTIDGVNG